MAIGKKVTSKAVASKAGEQLPKKNLPKDSKSAIGSALSQKEKPTAKKK